MKLFLVLALFTTTLNLFVECESRRLLSENARTHIQFMRETLLPYYQRLYDIVQTADQSKKTQYEQQISVIEQSKDVKAAQVKEIIEPMKKDLDSLLEATHEHLKGKSTSLEQAEFSADDITHKAELRQMNDKLEAMEGECAKMQWAIRVRSKIDNYEKMAVTIRNMEAKIGE